MAIQAETTELRPLPPVLRAVSRRAIERSRIRRLAVSLLACGALACGGIAETDELPPNVQDPAMQRNSAGAVARYRGALGLLPKTFDWFMTETSILTDELAALPTPLGVYGAYTGIDSRTDLSGFEGTYNRLQALRVQAHEARGFVAAYAPDSSPALVGHLYALEGIAEILLADLFCSGIPLSTVDFESDYTLAPGSMTTQVYEHAVALFDSAMTRTSDSVRFQHLAAIGRGRGLLALGRYSDAAASVAAVPTLYAYQVVFMPGLIANNAGPLNRLLWRFGDTRLANSTNPAISGLGYRAFAATPSVGNVEGLTGLNYSTAGDVRVRSAARTGTDPHGNQMFFPTKYPFTGNVTLTVADGIEARLIEAEAALQAGDYSTWLGMLNNLRQTAWTKIVPATTGPLPDLTDPGSDGSGTDVPRVDLMFRERAFWLYLTGHRQGDLRRLIRQYGRGPESVYPTGAFQGAGGTYGSEIVAPVPAAELRFNPKYAGCVHHQA